jgi:uncharacterized damage-inducible protein DinB
MGPKDVVRLSLDLSDQIVSAYLSDADLLIRPVPGMNHIAWQLGHLISSERFFVEAIAPRSCPPLPVNFEDGHGQKSTKIDDPSKYLPLAKYKELWKAQRDATRAVLDTLSDSDFDRRPETLPSFAPTVGAAINLCGSHALMHLGQFVAVRRQLGKPITI